MAGTCPIPYPKFWAVGKMLENILGRILSPKNEKFYANKQQLGKI